MKKYIISIAALLLLASAVTVFAVPAFPGKIVKTQPDGSKITILLHGDEFLHWETTEDGTVVAPDANGFYAPAAKPVVEMCGGREAAAREAAAIRAQRLSSANNGPSIVKNSVKTYHFPVVLVQFTDRQFTLEDPVTAFSNLFNQEGYSDNGATGSVHDYYWENSMGTFNAIFDVYGPYTYNGSVADNTEHADAAKILWAAIKSYGSQIDWSQYDNDNDGRVDMVFMYYAGWNQAEGETASIWPHKWSFSGAGVSTSSISGKSFSTYACSSELKGTAQNSGGMCGIGTAAHEFSHTQGLPDFYDTNYNTNGKAGATYNYDIMSSGSYNNEGRTPPYFNAEERRMMGWLSTIGELPSTDITIPSIDNNVAYRLNTRNTSANGEYFIFECRSGKGWDAPLPAGLLVYHVDKSSKYKISYDGYSFSADVCWSYYDSAINADGSHPCFYLIPSADVENLNYTYGSSGIPFPGSANVTSYIPKDWAGNYYDILSDISFNASGTWSGNTTAVVTMTRTSNYRGLSGTVSNYFGETLSGASVRLYAHDEASSISAPSLSAPLLISGNTGANPVATTSTDDKGQFSFNLSLYEGSVIDIEVRKDGYITTYESVTLAESSIVYHDVMMYGISQTFSSTLTKCDESYGGGGMGYGEGSDYTMLGSVKYTAEQLKPYVGRKIKSIAFVYDLGDAGTTSGVYALVDFGTTRKLVQQVSGSVSNQWTVVDVSSAGLTIPEGADCHFGYALENCTATHPWRYTANDYQEGGFEYVGYTSGTTTWRTSVSWGSTGVYNIMVKVELEELASTDFNCIANPGYGTYKVGQSFALQLNEATGNSRPDGTVSWFFDDEPVTGTGVILKYPGIHVVEARFRTVEGKQASVELEINVEL